MRCIWCVLTFSLRYYLSLQVYGKLAATAFVSPGARENFFPARFVRLGETRKGRTATTKNFVDSKNEPRR